MNGGDGVDPVPGIEYPPAVTPEVRDNQEPSNEGCAVSYIDAKGVDRSQIREMLQLTPEERLARVQEFVESMQLIWQLNEERPVR